MNRRGDVLALFGLGALIGTGADQIHVQAGVLSYAHPTSALLGQAFWVPLLFGGAGVVLVLGHAPLLRLARERAPRASIRGLGASLAWFLGAYASTAVFQGEPLPLTLALLLAWAARLAVAPTRETAIAGLLYAAAGSVFESGLSATGAFRYEHPDLLLVPAWLPALYLHVSLMTRQAYLALVAPRGAGALRSAASPSALRP